jgi:TolB-like protein/DNA-binding SARP family transcriptional activator/Tfp pilus assembly protein PilF
MRRAGLLLLCGRFALVRSGTNRTMLFLRLLGGPLLSRDGRALTGPAAQRHRLALLALLATSRSRPQSRDKLVGWLWPERDAKYARNLLNQSVHALRRAVGEAGIISVQDELRLDPSTIACDVVAFEDAIAAGEFERGIGLYTGPFLDGFHLPGAPEFAHWADGERDRLRRLYARGLESLAEAAEERREWGSAVERWRGLLSEEPYNGRVTLRLMRALEEAGDRAGALQQARLHTLLLQQEFEAEPDPDVSALADRLRTAPANAHDGRLAVWSPDRQSHDAYPHTGTSAPLEASTDEFASTADLAPVLDPSPSSVPGNLRRGSARWLLPILAAALGLGLVGGTWWETRRTGHELLGEPSPPPSVAVLPFVNMSPDGADEYFSDGMTEEITTALSRIEGLRVAARTSAFVFKDRSESVSEIGRQLGVETVLAGSVRRADGRLRIAVQLINVQDGYHLWAEIYDRDPRDVFAVQEEIAQAIVGALSVKLAGETTAIVVRPTADLTAYDLYLKGRHAVNQRRGESLMQAAGYFEQAIARDPRFAEAYAGLADAWVLMPGYNVTNSSESWPRARAAAERALALDSTQAEAHTTLAYGTFLFERDWRAAEHGFRRAIALNPGYATAHHWYGDFLGGRGDLEGYLQEIRLAHALDPLSGQIGTEVGRALWALRRNDEAITQLQQVLRADPLFAGAHLTLGRVYIQQDRLAEAIGVIQKAVQLRGRDPLDVAELAYAHALAGRRSEAEALLVELERRSRREYVQPTAIAIIHTGLGEHERAFDWLDRAATERDGWLAESIFYPTFDPLRSHPRYGPLLQALGLR